jgi:hypothetical protein
MAIINLMIIMGFIWQIIAYNAGLGAFYGPSIIHIPPAAVNRKVVREINININ